MMLEDARQAALSIFLTVPSTVPSTSSELETAGGDLTAAKIAGLFDRWPEAVALGEKMDFVQVTRGDERSHAILAAALSRGRPVSGHIYGREFVAAYAASGVTDTHGAIDRERVDDLLEAGLWLFLRRAAETPAQSSASHQDGDELGASYKRIGFAPTIAMRTTCACLGSTGAREAIAAGSRRAGLSMGSLHPATLTRWRSADWAAAAG
jgi:adenine deaminase